MKRKIKVYGKMRLFEASAVGLPAYPDAHASVDSFSLVKALTNASLRTGFVEEGENIIEAETTQLNLEEKEAMVENTESTVEVAKTEINKKIEVEETKTEVVSDAIVKAIADGIKTGFKELELERGLVEKQIPVKKSLGELTMGMHNSAYNLRF